MARRSSTSGVGGGVGAPASVAPNRGRGGAPRASLPSGISGRPRIGNTSAGAPQGGGNLVNAFGGFQQAPGLEGNLSAAGADRGSGGPGDKPVVYRRPPGQ